MGRIFAGQSALRISLRTFSDLGGVVSAFIKYKKPGGKCGRFSASVAVGSDGVIYHEVREGEIDEAGWWSFWAFLVFDDGRSAAGEVSKVFVWREGGLMARFKSAEERYQFNVRKQRGLLEDFASCEGGWAGDLLLWFRMKKLDVPDDEYRACAFFLNREYLLKPGSLSLLYVVGGDVNGALPSVTKENAFDLLRYRFRMYAKALEAGGY